MAYDPYEGLALDMLRSMTVGLEWVTLAHFYSRGDGLPVVDLVQEMLYDADQGYYLPEEFYSDWQDVADTEAFERAVFKWCLIFRKLRGQNAE